MSPFIQVRLQDGRELTSNCFIASTIYRGTLLMTPSDRVTQIAINHAKRNAQRFFGDQPIILVPPRIILDELDQPWLPDICMAAEFTSAPTQDSEEFQLSKAVVIWYQRELQPLIQDEVREDLAAIDWQANAANITLY